MKKLFLLLAAIGMTVAGANAQTQRLNRTNSRTATGTVQPQPTTTLPSVPANNTDAVDLRSSGANGVDGSNNTKATTGANRSSSLNYDYKANDVPAGSVPAVQSPGTTTTPATATPNMRANTTR